MKTVKIGMAEYRAVKALAKKQGRLLQHVLTEAVQKYLAAEQSKQEAA